MKNWAFIVCFALLVSSCNSILSSKPIGILNEDQMTDILVDIQLTEATLKTVDDSIFRKTDTTDLRNRFAGVFKKHDVDPDNFNASINYYLEHIEELDKIYVEVITRLTEMEASMIPIPNVTAGNTQNGSFIDPRNPWHRPFFKTIVPIESQYFSGSVYQHSSDDRPAYHGPGKGINR
jgi:hypothetical protein